MKGHVDAHFGRHPDEFGDDRNGCATAKSRKNYVATSPIPEPPAERRSLWPGSSITIGSSMP